MKTSKTRVLLCVVMTLLMLTVAMSVSAETATVGTVTTAVGDGDVVVTVPVSGVSGKATIMVYPEGMDLAAAKADPMTNIKYIDEATATDGEAVFTFAVAEGQYNMTVGGGGVTATTTALDATVNVAPVYAEAAVTVAKNSGACENEAIGTYAAEDEGDTLTYDIDADAKAAGFAIDTATGAVTFTGTFEDGAYTVIVTATDSKGATATCVVTVNVTTPNTAPTFGDVNTEITVDEGTTAIGTFAATDADEDALEYTLTANSEAEANFAVDNAGNVTYNGYLEPGTYYIKVNVTDGKADDSISLTITVNAVNTAPVFEAETAEATLAVGKYTTAQELVTIAAEDAENDALTYSVDAEGFAVDTEGKVTFTGEITADLTATITVRDAMYEDSYVLTVTATNDGFAAVSVAPIETVVKVAEDAADFSAAVGIPETVTVKYMYGEVEKEAEIAIAWDFETVEAEGIENNDTVNGVLDAAALAEANIVLGEVSAEVSFTYELVASSFEAKINQYDAEVVTAVAESELNIDLAYVGLGEATYAYKTVAVNDLDSENEVPADEEFAAELEAITAPAHGEGYRLIIYAKDSITGSVLKAVKFVYGNNPFLVSVTLDGQARYWKAKNGEAVQVAVDVTDVNTNMPIEVYEVSYKAVSGETEIAADEDGVLTITENGAYIVIAEVNVDGVVVKGQRTLYIADTAFAASITVNGTASAQKVAANSDLNVAAVADYIPEAGLEWYTSVVAYADDTAAIEADWAAFDESEAAVVLNAGEAGTKKVVALFRRAGEMDAEITQAKTVYVRDAEGLYMITEQSRDGADYEPSSIGDNTIALGIKAVDGPSGKGLDELSAKIVIRDYASLEALYTYDIESATDAAEVKAADWGTVNGGAVRVTFELYDGEAKVGSVTRVLFL